MKIPDNLLNEKFDDRYFDVIDAIDEAQYIHFKNNDLLSKMGKGRIIIGETGFGAGRIVVSLMEYLRKNNITDADIEYYTCELYPVSADRMRTILDIFRERVSDEIEILLSEYEKTDLTVEGFHKLVLKGVFGRITVYLWIGEALDMVNQLNEYCDLWFLDGHGPKKNPSIWRSELLHAIGGKTKYMGECSTFTVSVAVRSALQEAGFTLEKLPGSGRKNEVLHGIKNKGI